MFIKDRLNSMQLKILVAATAPFVSGLAHADTVGDMVNVVCKIIGPLVGPNSKYLSLVFLLFLGVMIFMWWSSESKEGVITWILRTGIALGILINLFTFPQIIGLPSIC